MKPEISETIKAFFATLGFLFVLLPIILIGIPWEILSTPGDKLLFDIGEFRFFGLVPIIAGVLIYFWCSYNFVFFGKGTPIPSMPPKEFVAKGLYRFVRNPMYIAGFFVLGGEVLFFRSTGLFIYLLVLFGIIHLLVLAVEEPRLEKRFGGTYKRYCRSVRRWIPRLKPYRER